VCNSYKARKSVEEVAAWFGQRPKPAELPLLFSEGPPNLEPRDAIKITDRAAIIKATPAGYDLVSRRWSWPGPTGKPVYNFRSEGRKFASRCVIPCEAFYEFTDPQPGEKLKTRWAFTMPGEEMFCIAGTIRPWEDSEAWSMLTVDPGPDVAPYHSRQVVALSLDDGLRWLDGAPEGEILRPSPAGTLEANRA
jgi:putative SOS response-associated peptidase YedK